MYWIVKSMMVAHVYKEYEYKDSVLFLISFI